MSRFETVHVVYDGQCTFCVQSLRLFRAFALVGVLRFHDAADRNAVAMRFPQLRDADFDDSMYAVTARGRVYGGFYTFRRLAWSSPLAWPFLPLLYFPGVAFIGSLVYAWIARNRQRFGCRTDACALPMSEHARPAPEQLPARDR